MADRKSSKPKKPKTARWQRIAMMDKEILDVEGAATLLGVSTTTVYNLARKGEIPATRVGREWRFARANLIQWVANGAAADQLSVALSRRRVAKKSNLHTGMALRRFDVLLEHAMLSGILLADV